MLNEPASRKLRYMVERTWLLKQVRGTGHNRETMLTRNCQRGGAVEFKHVGISFTNNQQCRGGNLLQPVVSQIRTPAPTDNCSHHAWILGSSTKRGSSTRACTEQTNHHLFQPGIVINPPQHSTHTARQQLDIESQARSSNILGFLIGREEIHKQRRQMRIVEDRRNVLIPRAEPAAAAPVRKDHQADTRGGNMYVAPQHSMFHRNAHMAFDECRAIW